MSFDPDQAMDARDMDLVIDARNVGKCYHVYERPSHRLLQGFQRSEERDHGRAVFFFPVLQVESAVFNHRLAFCGSTRHPDCGFQ